MTTSPDPPDLDNPFPGLRPFRKDEEHLFFGRESQVDTMVDKLARTRFLAVVGTSGSGKSSLVNCGLRPALHRGLMAAAGTSWRMVQCRPGSQPIRTLSRALADEEAGLFGTRRPEGISLAGIVEATLRLSKLGLADVYEQAQSTSAANLLVVVDQFEELFRYRGVQSASAAHERSEESVAFVKLLLEARAQEEFPIYVVLTMRSDFLGDCAQLPGLAEAINESQYLVPRMTRDERRSAIAGPVGVGGATISPVLLTRLVNDVGDNPDQLSILQHALNRTWAEWQRAGQRDEPLSLSHYESIGTMAHALDRHAEKAYGELTDERQRRICERFFKTLTDTGSDPRGVRRPTTLGRLCAIANTNVNDATRVIDVFRKPSRSFLMPPISEPLEPDTVIDISHESLMRVWERLKIWADEEARSAQLYRRLSDTAALHGKGEAGLWSNPDLQFALGWVAKEQPSSAWAEIYGGRFDAAMSFLNRSKAADEARRDEDKQRREAEQLRLIAEARREEETKAREEKLRTETLARHRERRLRHLAWWLAAGAVGVAALAIYYWIDADRQGQVAISRLFAARSAMASSQSDRFLPVGALLAAESYRRQPSSEAQGLLAEALALMPPKLGSASHKGARKVMLSQGGEYIASYGRESTARLWAAKDGTPAAEWLHAAPVTALAFAPNGRTAATGTDTGEIKVWQVGQPRPIAELECGKSVKAIALASDTGPLVAMCEQLHEWRTENEWRSAQLHRTPLSGFHAISDRALISIDQQGKRLAIADPGSVATTVAVVDCATGKTVESSDITSPVSAIALDPASARLAVALARGPQTGLVIIWPFERGEAAFGETSFEHASSVTALAFNATGKSLTVAGADGVTKIWSTQTFREAARVSRDSPMIAVSAATSRIAGLSEDGALHVWALSGVDFSDTLTTATFSAGARYLIARGALTVRLWDVESEQPGSSWLRLRAARAEGYPTAISPDHKLIALRDRSGTNVTFTIREFVNGKAGDTIFADKLSGYLSWPEFSPDSRHVAAILRPPGGSGKNILVTWDVGEKRRREWTDFGAATRLRFSADSGRIAVAGADEIALVDPGTGRAARTLTGIKDIAAIAVSPDGTRLAASENAGEPPLRDSLAEPDDEPDLPQSPTMNNGRVVVWNLDDGRQIASFEHPGRASPIVFDSDSRHLLTGSSDGAARIWTLDPVQEVMRMPVSSRIYAVAFRPDSRFAIATRTRLASYFWKPEDLLREVCARAARNITNGEWARFVGGQIPRNKTCPSLD
jgi:WD40 repeat protein